MAWPAGWGHCTSNAWVCSEWRASCFSGGQETHLNPISSVQNDSRITEAGIPEWLPLDRLQQREKEEEKKLQLSDYIH